MEVPDSPGLPRVNKPRPVSPPPRKRVTTIDLEAVEYTSEDFEVEDVLDVLVRDPPYDKVPLYLIKWEGYPSSANTWESEVSQLSKCFVDVNPCRSSIAT